MPEQLPNFSPDGVVPVDEDGPPDGVGLAGPVPADPDPATTEVQPASRAVSAVTKATRAGDRGGTQPTYRRDHRRAGAVALISRCWARRPSRTRGRAATARPSCARPAGCPASLPRSGRGRPRRTD